MATHDHNEHRPEPAARPQPHAAGPCAMVIFGAAGDLANRKLLPALYNLAAARLLPDGFAVIGFANDELDTDAFREEMRRAVNAHLPPNFDPALLDWVLARLEYVVGDFLDPAAYDRLGQALAAAQSKHGTAGNALFYLATPPRFFGDITTNLGRAGLVSEAGGQWRRVVYEKPFGRDLESARALNAVLRGALGEDQIYRIDHYLGKETVQNIMVFRFGNGIFEPIWNRRYVNHVQITVAEELGVEHRAGYYEKAGALRDMVPNHLFQLLALTAMEPPISFEADAVRDEKAKILRAIQPMSPEEVLTRTVRGQYGEGALADGTKVTAYRAEPGVAPDSATETYVAMKLLVDNWRWAGVPFYLRTGKRMKQHVTEIAIQFHRAPFMLFRETPVERLSPNILVLRIQPNEEIFLRFGAKVPGPELSIGSVDMEFSYQDYFGGAPTTGYETLLYDCMRGDATLFQRADHVEIAWAVVAPILDVWSALPPRTFPNYAAGSAGPAEAGLLLQRDGRAWREI
ncbi:MAG TPA: glucose-6-phosphate dehydrogenase [Thermoanaerobaculaceae bacterium]|nr:glucose-6-phosphate dehydrogenase [Thermoanaerobaculaceae bacterium]